MPHNPKIAIIGAGISGLVYSLQLSKLGIEHDIYESSPHLGGRAREIYHTGQTFIDNGQHMLSGSYSSLTSLLDEIHPIWKEFCHSIYPWQIYNSDQSRYILGRSELSLSLLDLATIIKMSLSIKILESNLSNNRIYKKFLMPFCLSVFALRPEQVPQKTLQIFIKKFLLDPRLYLPTISLSQLLINPLAKAIQAKKMGRFIHQRVTQVLSKNHVHQVYIKNKSTHYQNIVFALPPTSLIKIFPWLPTVNQKNITTLYTNNHRSYAKPKLTLSSLDNIEWEILLSDKKVYIGSGHEDLSIASLIKKDEEILKEVKMKSAVTDISCPQLTKLQQEIDKLPFTFIGDWALPNWPCTIESAVRSAQGALIKS